MDARSVKQPFGPLFAQHIDFECFNPAGMHKMTPPIKDLLPRLTPILKNRHEKVQENCIDLVGRIADRSVQPRVIPTLTFRNDDRK